MKRARITVVAAAAAAALALSACGGGAKPSGPADASGGGAAPAAGNGFSAWALTGARETTMKNSFDQWTSAHSEQAAKVEYFANDSYKEKIRTAVGSGNAPTLIWSWSGGTLKDYVKNNKAVDLTESTKKLQGNLALRS